MRQRRAFVGGWNRLEAWDLCCILDQSEQNQPPIYDVSSAGGVPLFQSTADDDATGLITIWAVTAPPAPYVIDPKGVTGVIAPNGTKRCTPDSLNLNTNELVQARVKIRLIDTSPASGAVIDDFSLRAYLPGSSAVWGTSNAAGVLSARRQIGDGADSVSAPLQGSDQAGPAYASVSGWESADQTELFWFGTNSQPTFEVVYFGSGNTPAGIAIALEISGYRYLLKTHPAGARRVVRGGVTILVPDDAEIDDIIPIEIAGRAASSL